MRHGVVFGGGEWGVDREMARVSFDPRRLTWVRSDEERAGEQGRREDVGGCRLGELRPIDVHRGGGGRSALEADPGPDRQAGVELGLAPTGYGRGLGAPPGRVVSPGMGQARSPASVLCGLVGGFFGRPHDVRDAQDLRGLGGAGEGQEGGRCGGGHGGRDG